MHLPRAPRRASDAFLYMSHRPGDDNYNNPITNVDFLVTPPAVRSVSLSQVTGSFEEAMDSYFRSNITRTYSPDSPTIPEKQVYESPTNDIHLLDRDKAEGHTDCPAPASPPKSKVGSISRILKNDLHSVKREPAVNGHRTRDESQREKPFGTNLTTGKREYLNQYQHMHHGHAANATDMPELTKSPKETRQEDTLSYGNQKEGSDSTGEIDTTGATETSTYSSTALETGRDYVRESGTSTPLEIY